VQVQVKVKVKVKVEAEVEVEVVKVRVRVGIRSQKDGSKKVLNRAFSALRTEVRHRVIKSISGGRTYKY
jgi:hypothetical protein